jgi:hypothetical protein
MISPDDLYINTDTKNKKKVTLEDRIKNLPYDIKKKIYYDYFETIYNYPNKVIKELNTYECIRLNIIRLQYMIPIILNHDYLIQYFLKNSNEFRNVYEGHECDKQIFVLMDKTQSFALSWLYYLYH